MPFVASYYLLHRFLVLLGLITAMVLFTCRESFWTLVCRWCYVMVIIWFVRVVVFEKLLSCEKASWRLIGPHGVEHEFIDHLIDYVVIW